MTFLHLERNSNFTTLRDWCGIPDWKFCLAPTQPVLYNSVEEQREIPVVCRVIYGARLCNHVNSGVDVGTLTLDMVMSYEIFSAVEASCIRIPNL